MALQYNHFVIFYAFNYLSDNAPMFRNFIAESIRKCTDKDLADALEMWVLSYNLTFNGIDREIVSNINKGIRLIAREKWAEAESLFGILTKQANTVAPPWFYSGVIKYHNDEQFSAESMFSRAMERFPMYVAPRIYNFEMAYAQGDFENLLKEVNEAIDGYNTWLFYFWKAKTLFALKRYKEVVRVLEEDCNALNPWSVDASILLGDAYLELKDFDKAERAYRRTQVINPYMESGVFDKKMSRLLEMKKSNQR
jgi:tetratricopeptide (TPR) repeat protein